MGDESIQQHDGDDYVREALNRHRFEERFAHGYVEDEEVIIETKLETDGIGKMFVHAGGEFHEYKQGVGPDYTGGEYYGVPFEHVHELEQAFDRLVEKYDLHEYDQ